MQRRHALLDFGLKGVAGNLFRAAAHFADTVIPQPPELSSLITDALPLALAALLEAEDGVDKTVVIRLLEQFSVRADKERDGQTMELLEFKTAVIAEQKDKVKTLAKVTFFQNHFFYLHF